MKVVTGIKQGSEEWKAIRWSKVGGSSASDLFVKQIYGSAIFHRICAERCEEFDEFEDQYINKDMQRGNDLEPYARQELERITGLTFDLPAWIQSDINILGISPDGVTSDFKIGAEFKCPTRQVYNKYLLNNNLLVDQYAHQIATNFAVIEGIEVMYMCAYRPEHKYKKIIIVEVTRETVFNNGTEAKPVMYTIGQLANDIRAKSNELDALCSAQIEAYKF